MNLFRRLFLTFRGQLFIFSALLVTVGLTVFLGYRRNQQNVAGDAPPKPPAVKSVAGDDIPAGRPVPIITDLGRTMVKLAVPEPPPKDLEIPVRVIPADVRRMMLADPIPLSLFSDRPIATKRAVEEVKPATPGSVYAPYGRMVVCRLVNAVDSANLETPVVGIVLEDVWNRDENGVAQIVVPAGAEVHGSASRGRVRDRIDVNGRFVFVWRTGDEDNGLEMTVTGLALHRSFDEATGIFGIDDGSAGLRGEIIETDDYAEVKLFLSRFLGGLGSGLVSQNGLLNPLTSQVVTTPKQTVTNAALQGADAVLQEYTDRIRDSLKKDGFYVAVRPGKTFYVYVKETIDKRIAHRGAFLAANQPKISPDHVASTR